MFGSRRTPDSSHQIDGGKKLRTFTNFMVQKKTPEFPRSPEDPYFLKDMEENALELLNLSRGRGRQMEMDINLDNIQRFRTPGEYNVSNSVHQNENNAYDSVNPEITGVDEDEINNNGDTSFDINNYGNQYKNPVIQPKISVTPAYKEIVITEPDTIPCWREFNTKIIKISEQNGTITFRMEELKT
jgi:hypothetical protein